MKCQRLPTGEPTLEVAMLWAIDRPRRHRALRASERQLVSVSKAEQELPCHGHAYFGGLEAFAFECPGLGYQFTPG